MERNCYSHFGCDNNSTGLKLICKVVMVDCVADYDNDEEDNDDALMTIMMTL